MIVIVSNGKMYSDHKLYFVEAPSVAAVEAVMHPLDQFDYEGTDRLNPEAKVVGTVEGLLTWTDRAPHTETMSLASFENQAKEYL